MVRRELVVSLARPAQLPSALPVAPAPFTDHVGPVQFQGACRTSAITIARRYRLESWSSRRPAARVVVT
jgi:hypothetical protein